MRISIFGFGYVGATTGACLAKEGHHVIGVDPQRAKLDLIAAGKSPIVEEGLEELIAAGVSSGRLSVTTDYRRAVAETDISLICVGTPSLPNGALRLDYVEKVAHEIGEGIREKGSYHSVVVRSTVLPGTTEGVVIPILERETGGRAGDAFGISMNPEFLREGVSIADYYDPPFTIIGAHSAAEFERVRSMYGSVKGEFIHCRVSTAEAIKYGCNVLHALKITFANEMGIFCKQHGVDAHEVMEILCKDTKLNISAKYMKPGFAFGGSCLPKDLRACIQAAKAKDAALPMFEAALESNRRQIERVADRVMSFGSRKVSMMGVAFKEGTDDLRESPLVALAEILIGKGYALRIYDPNVHYASLHGSNREVIDRDLPHLKSALCSADEALAHGDVLVFGHNTPEMRALAAKARENQTLIDLVRVISPRECLARYEGLYW